MQQVAACCVEICKVVEGAVDVRVKGGEGGEGSGTAGKHQVINKRGIHRRQANEADETCA